MGLPVIRPLWVEFPRDKNTWATEDQFMVGNSLLVHPVTDQGATSVQLYLPGATTVSGRDTRACVYVGVICINLHHAAVRVYYTDVCVTMIFPP